MGQDIVIRTLLGLCAAVLVLVALYLARSIFAPVAFSLFVIAIAWPFQSWLQQRIPKLLALAVTIFVIFDASNGAVIHQGSAVSRAPYSRYQEIFANVRARYDAENRAAEAVSESIKTQVAAFLASSA
jgi:predicted PurR-regulated permease PerM